MIKHPRPKPSVQQSFQQLLKLSLGQAAEMSYLVSKQAYSNNFTLTDVTVVPLTRGTCKILIRNHGPFSWKTCPKASIIILLYILKKTQFYDLPQYLLFQFLSALGLGFTFLPLFTDILTYYSQLLHNTEWLSTRWCAVEKLLFLVLNTHRWSAARSKLQLVTAFTFSLDLIWLLFFFLCFLLLTVSRGLATISYWTHRKALCTTVMPSVLWRCWLGGRKDIRPVKTEW